MLLNLCYFQAKVIVFIGQTGEGKSETAKQLFQLLCSETNQGSVENPFKSSSSADSATQDCIVSQPVGNIIVVDTPGLADSSGIEDRVQTEKIIVDLKKLTRVDMLVLVRQYRENPRFDKALQAMIKLCFDAFGTPAQSNMVFLFTCCNRLDQLKKLDPRCKEFVRMFSETYGGRWSDFNCPAYGIDFLYQVDGDLATYLTPEQKYQAESKVVERSKENMRSLVTYCKTLSPIVTKILVLVNTKHLQVHPTQYCSN